MVMKMNDRKIDITVEEVFDTEVCNELWDIFFPYTVEKKEKVAQKKRVDEKKRHSDYYKFLLM